MRTLGTSIGPTSRGLRAERVDGTNIGRAIRAMHQALHDLEWLRRPDGTAQRIRVDFGPPYIPVSQAIVAISADTRAFIVCFDLGPPVESEREWEMIQFVTRANAGLLNGSFDVDLDQRSIHFRTGVAFGAGELSEKVIRATLETAMHAVSAHSNALMLVMAGEVEAEEAIREVWARHDREPEDG